MLKKVLEAREARWEHRLDLVNKTGKPLVTFCMNLPGSDKTSSIFLKAHEKLLSELIQYFKDNELPILKIESRVDADGPEAFLVVDSEAVNAKKLTLAFEEVHPAGRLMDLDVMDIDRSCISREQLSLPPRKCLLCNAPARECIVLRRHEKEEVIARVVEIVNNYLQECPE